MASSAMDGSNAVVQLDSRETILQLWENETVQNRTKQRNIIAASLRKGKTWIIRYNPTRARNRSIREHDATKRTRSFDWKYNRREMIFHSESPMMSLCTFYAISHRCVLSASAYGNSVEETGNGSWRYGKMGALTVSAHARSWHLNHSEYAPPQPYALKLG